MWIFSQVGANGGTLNAPNQVLLQPGQSVTYPIPNSGLAATRFWPGLRCNDQGGDCEIGQSGGPSSEGFTCPQTIGCAPAVDSKFEATFGCSLSDTTQCLNNPSGPGKLGPNDYWDTSMVDGYTLPYTVQVVGSCPAGPTNNFIDCSGLQIANCPVNIDLRSPNGTEASLASVNLVLYHPITNNTVGCYSPCAKLTDAQWAPAGWTVYSPSAGEAEWFCCPTPPISSPECRSGPGGNNQYVSLIHTNCPQTYAYGYDDNVGNWNCPATVTYNVVFYCPGGSVNGTSGSSGTTGSTGGGTTGSTGGGDGGNVGVIVGATIGSVAGFVLLMGVAGTIIGFLVYKFYLKAKFQTAEGVV